jgi:hypothetical protein
MTVKLRTGCAPVWKVPTAFEPSSSWRWLRVTGAPHLHHSNWPIDVLAATNGHSRTFPAPALSVLSQVGDLLFATFVTQMP